VVVLTECLEDHEDNIILLFLTDSETILQVIHRWIVYGTKLNLSKSPDTDVLKKNILKLQKRVQVGAVTLLVKVKVHRGDPLNHQCRNRYQIRNGTPQRTKGGHVEQPNQQNGIPIDDRTIY
jgi:ribonuclease HI